MGAKPKINESSEDYLETILILSEKKPVVRSVDVAEEMGFKKSSVSVGMKHLREKGFVTFSNEGYISLTSEGRKIAEMIYERHTVISEWLISLGVDSDTALEDACRMEHCMSEETFGAMKRFIEDNMKQ